jgi:hypothetical protein
LETTNFLSSDIPWRQNPWISDHVPRLCRQYRDIIHTTRQTSSPLVGGDINYAIKQVMLWEIMKNR